MELMIILIISFIINFTLIILLILILKNLIRRIKEQSSEINMLRKLFELEGRKNGTRESQRK